MGGKSERNNSPTGSVPFVASGRARRFLRRCSVGVGLGVGATVNFGVAVGEAAVSSAMVVADTALSSGITVGDAALGSCVGVGTSIGLGVATIGAPIVACSQSTAGWRLSRRQHCGRSERPLRSHRRQLQYGSGDLLASKPHRRQLLHGYRRRHTPCEQRRQQYGDWRWSTVKQHRWGGKHGHRSVRSF